MLCIAQLVGISVNMVGFIGSDAGASVLSPNGLAMNSSGLEPLHPTNTVQSKLEL